MSRSTIQRRVFDAFPEHPKQVRIVDVYAALPMLDQHSVRMAIHALKKRGLIEPMSVERFAYRRVEGAEAPTDERGGARPGAGRKRTNAITC